jgi:hypothetical protein
MALTAYETQTQALLQLPGASPQTLYPIANIDTWINIARGQLAGEGECIRVIATIPTVVGQRNYNFSALNTGVAATTGIQGVIHVRRITLSVASGQRWIAPRAWPWFDLYYMNNPVPQNGLPKNWAQYAQGVNGSFYLDPPPDNIYQLNCDCVCYPINLASDTTVEAIPYLWTDAVPFFAAYYALLSSQTSARQADAERLFGHYQTFVGRARQFANPSVNRFLYEQAGDPAQANAYGLQAGKGAA